jgi:hypothetical protein
MRGFICKHLHEPGWVYKPLTLVIYSLVPRSHHAHTRGKGVWGRIGADSCMVLLQCKLMQLSCDYLHRLICIGARSITWSDGAQDQENSSMSPDPFPLEEGSGNVTSLTPAHVSVISHSQTPVQWWWFKINNNYCEIQNLVCAKLHAIIWIVV